MRRTSSYRSAVIHRLQVYILEQFVIVQTSRFILRTSALNLQDPTQFLAIFNTRVRPYIKNISILLQLSRIDLICHAVSRETHIHKKKPLHCAALGVLANFEMEASYFYKLTNW